MGIKYHVDEKFFDGWSPIMAYVLGYFYADGSMYPSVRGKYIVVTSIDRSTILKIKKWLHSHHTVREESSTWANGKKRYILRIGNAALYEALKLRGLYPNKSLTIKIPTIPRKFLKDFVRGYFDGDGCVYLYRSAGISQLLILRKLSIIFTSGSKRFLIGLLAQLKKELPLNQKNIYRGQRSFQLRLSTGDSVSLFKFMYGGVKSDVFLRRKYDTFSRYFKLRPQRIDGEVKAVLQFIGNGHVAK
ncbi:MAG: LAGLIDADG family homing endonuclease [Candidatus Brennerbacteria bacterium]